MKFKRMTLVISLGALAALATSIGVFAQAGQDANRFGHQARIIEFDAPDAGTSSGQGTTAHRD